LFPEAVWHGDRNIKKIYLTFDDGPIPVVTDYILDILKDFDVKATFFLVGENVKRNPLLFERLITEEHCIGNHTYNHIDGWKVNERVYLENIRLCSEVFKQSGWNVHPKIFRPPYGKIRKRTLNKIKHEYKVIMWDVLSYDFSNKVDSNECLYKSLKYTKNGSIIIFHDNVKSFEKIKFVISKYISSLKDFNYEFGKISDIF
jgi:peptidoglycan/xylan/chitin deacetylase (PgdA/CDA1 family)